MQKCEVSHLDECEVREELKGLTHCKSYILVEGGKVV